MNDQLLSNVLNEKVTLILQLYITIKGYSYATMVQCSAVVRYYQAKLNPNEWTLNSMGVLVFTQSNALQLLQLNTWNQLWSFTPNLSSMKYEKDRPFFHSFVEGAFVSGFCFASEDDADVMFQNISSALTLSRSSSRRPSVQSIVSGNARSIPPAPPRRAIIDEPSSPKISRSATLTPRRPSVEMNSSASNSSLNQKNDVSQRPNQFNSSANNTMRNDINQKLNPHAPSRPLSRAETQRQNPSLKPAMSSPKLSPKSDKSNLSTPDQDDPKKEKSIFSFGRKKEKKIDKMIISGPTNFQHISHVGYNPETGFNAQNIPIEWKAIFAKAGITELELKDKKKAKVIMKFMSEHGKDVPPVKPTRKAAPPPPPPGRTMQKEATPDRMIQKEAPPPERIKQKEAPPPERKIQREAPPPPMPREKQSSNTQPPMIPDRVPRATDRSAPPPVPNRNVPPTTSAPPPPPPIPSRSPDLNTSVGPTPPPPPPPMQKGGDNARADLLSAIRLGSSLKAPTPNHKEKEEEGEEDLAAAIRAALDARKGAFMDSDEEDDEEEEDGW